jgi:ribose/xylose/arabinose/galactoside ABC-type transport system permease subunit
VGASIGQAEGRRAGRWSGVDAKLVVTAALLLVILVVLLVLAPSFFRPNNLVNVLVQTSSLGLMAVGMAPVMIAGGIDLSSPANMALGAVLGAMFIQAGGNPVVGCLIMVAAATLVGLLNGVAVALLGMIPFVVTLATMTVATGSAVWLTHSVSVSGFPDSFYDVLLARLGGVPVSVFVLIAAVIILGVVMSATPFGRYLYATGINPRAALVARVPVRAATCASYAVSGLMAGLTAVLLSARLGSASANMGNDGVVLDVVSACVVGGVSIYGGSGYVTGAALGALVITLLSNNLNLLGVSYYLNLMTKGVVIIGFVALDGLRRRAS